MFENRGLAPGVAEDTRLEYGVCGWVYDPAEGDPSAPIPPGTPVAALPAMHRGAGKFLVVRDDR